MSRTYEELSAKNELTIPQQQADDGWGDAADEQSDRIFRGTMLKFADRLWSPLEEGTKLSAVSTAKIWVKWVGKKKVDHRMRQPGQPFPERYELGDLDQELWENGLNGEPRDPWQLTRFVYLVDPHTAEMFTFSNASAGAHSAVTALAEQIQLMRMAHPHATPIIELRWADMQTKYGMKSKPLFKVTGWRGLVEMNEAPETPETPKLPLFKGRGGVDLDDEIPF